MSVHLPCWRNGNVTFPPKTGARAIIKVSGHQHRLLTGGYDLEIGHFLEVASMVVTWCVVAFLRSVRALFISLNYMSLNNHISHNSPIFALCAWFRKKARKKTLHQVAISKSISQQAHWSYVIGNMIMMYTRNMWTGLNKYVMGNKVAQRLHDYSSTDEGRSFGTREISCMWSCRWGIVPNIEWSGVRSHCQACVEVSD